VALHTFADTWAHQDFSGRNCQPDNDIDDLQERRPGSDWAKVAGVTNYLMPLGHLQARTYPDQSEAEWKCSRKVDQQPIGRKNSDFFLTAAKRVYEELQKIPRAGEGAEWEPLADRILAVFSLPLTAGAKIVNTLDIILDKIGLASLVEKYRRKCIQHWIEAFPEVNFSYDREEWRRLTLAGRHHKWDDFGEKDYQRLTYVYTKNPIFFYFHVAAKEQREFVHRNIFLTLR
jgi:hypothetical protein